MQPDPTPLTQAARRRHEAARARAVRALHELDHEGAPVTFELVARHAAVSRSWLYTQPDLRAEIEQLRQATRRSPQHPIPSAQRATDASLLRRLESTLERNRHLAEDNKRLRRQLAHALGDRRTSGNVDQHEYTAP